MAIQPKWWWPRWYRRFNYDYERDEIEELRRLYEERPQERTAEYLAGYDAGRREEER